MCIKNHMKGRLSPGSKKSWGAESQESQLDLQASWHQGKVVGVPRTALLRHLPATLCPASSRRYNTIDTRVSASPPTLSTLTLEGKSPNWQTFLTSHFILQPAKGIPCLLFFLQHTDMSLITLWQTLALPTPSGSGSVELIMATHSDDPHYYHSWTLHSTQNGFIFFFLVLTLFFPILLLWLGTFYQYNTIHRYITTLHLSTVSILTKG